MESSLFGQKLHPRRDDDDNDDYLIALELGTQPNTTKTSFIELFRVFGDTSFSDVDSNDDSGLIGGVYGVTIAGMVRDDVTGSFIKPEEE